MLARIFTRPRTPTHPLAPWPCTALALNECLVASDLASGNPVATQRSTASVPDPFDSRHVTEQALNNAKEACQRRSHPSRLCCVLNQRCPSHSGEYKLNLLLSTLTQTSSSSITKQILQLQRCH